jgi:hypothetical protein
MIDLWTEASRDVEAEHSALRMAQAKVAVAGLWPFLALAQSESEFEHRLALAADHIANAVPVDLLHNIHESLRADYLTVTAKDAEGEEEADDEDDDGKPDWLQKKIQGEAAYFHAGLGAWVAVDGGEAIPDENKPTQQELARERIGLTTDPHEDPEEEGYWNSLGNHQEGQAAADPTQYHGAYYHAGRREWITAAVEEGSGGGNPYYFTGGPEGGPNTGQTNQFPPHPTGADPVDPINGEYPAQPQPWTVPPGGEWREEPMNFNPPGGGHHPASRLPFAHAAEVGDQTRCANCRGPIKMVKVSWGSGKSWTHTGEHGLAGDDDHEPIPARNAAYKLAEEGVEGRPGPNPHYFSGGGEGVGGDGPSGFPVQPPPGDPEDRVNELYANPVQPEQDYGNKVAGLIFEGLTPDNPAPDSNKLQGTEFASSEERERWNTAEDPNAQQGPRDSSPSPTASLRHTAPGGGEHPPYRVEKTDGGYHVVNGKGESKSDHPQSKEQAEAQQRALYANTHESRRAGFFHDPADPGVHTVAVGSNPFADFMKDPTGAGAGGGGGMTDEGPGAATSNPNAPALPGAPQPGVTPATTAPRQVPGGGPSASDDAAKQHADQRGTAMASLRFFAEEEDARGLPTAEDPTGLGDEYRERTINGPIESRPRQPMDHRNVNTPQKPGDQIPTVSSPGPEPRDERREAARVAAWAVEGLVSA